MNWKHFVVYLLLGMLCGAALAWNLWLFWPIAAIFVGVIAYYITRD